MKYNKLTFITDVNPYIRPNGSRLRKSLWLCDCGVYTETNHSSVKQGVTKSCGCLHTEKVGKHGMANSKIYKIWEGLKGRCQNKKNEKYPRYGARGITVCDKWQTFQGFYGDMGDCPKGMQIDRNDNNLGYYKENCRWVRRKINMQNNSRSKRWVINGILYMSATEAAKFCGVDSSTIQNWCNGKVKAPPFNSYSYLVYR